ncbi:Aryl-alcohol dehydrogenase (fragment) [Xenorhabdus bovienii str. puntauvense]|uniref:Aryl-alcohol dehydrogenase n=1 Tax=Xenorhabdus bovienii str. puntauvense TaxID=1398201 RepID=A0A077NJJ0_XENBV
MANLCMAQLSFATYMIAKDNNTIKVPKTAPFAMLGPLGCGIQTGAGAVGLSAVMAARVVGATMIIAVNIVTSQMALKTEE